MKPTSIVKKLFLIQCLLALFSLVLLVSGSKIVISQQLSSRIEYEKELLIPILSAKEDEWIAWTILGLNHAIQSDFSEIIKSYHVKNIKTIPRPSNPNEVVDQACIYIPKNWQSNKSISNIIEACIDDTFFKSQSLNEMSLVYLGILFLVSFFLFSAFSVYLIHKEVYFPFRQLQKALEKISVEDGLEIGHISASGEIKELFESFSTLWNKSQQLERERLLTEVASQVSHDIRSPLSVLNLLLSNLEAITEEKKIILKSAINRINEISNELLNYSKVNSNSLIKPMKLEIVSLNDVVNSVVSEMKIAISEYRSIQIKSNINERYSLFSKINPTEMKRLLTNIINNSIESFTNQQGVIEISLKLVDQKILLIVTDNGSGIQPEVLKKLGKRGVTYGKSGTNSGTGLGLYHAIKTIEQFNGKIDITSSLGIGTSIVITLDKATNSI